MEDHTAAEDRVDCRQSMHHPLISDALSAEGRAEFLLQKECAEVG